MHARAVAMNELLPSGSSPQPSTIWGALTAIAGAAIVAFQWLASRRSKRNSGGIGDVLREIRASASVVRALSEDVRELRADVKEVRGALREVRKEVGDVTERLAELEADVAELKRLHELGPAQAVLKDRIDTLTKEIDLLRPLKHLAGNEAFVTVLQDAMRAERRKKLAEELAEKDEAPK